MCMLEKEILQLFEEFHKESIRKTRKTELDLTLLLSSIFSCISIVKTISSLHSSKHFFCAIIQVKSHGLQLVSPNTAQLWLDKPFPGDLYHTPERKMQSHKLYGDPMFHLQSPRMLFIFQVVLTQLIPRQKSTFQETESMCCHGMKSKCIEHSLQQGRGSLRHF